MNNRKLYLGIDTSNYKTSLAVIDDAASVVYEKSELLEVKKGKRGLRQSEAFFQHSMRLPLYIEEAFSCIHPAEIAAIGYSDKPRRQPGSYMPCFNAGVNSAKLLSSALGVPAYPFSHQEGHAAAIIPQSETGRIVFMHLSGGTTEFLTCKADDMGYDMRIVGGTKDISFGQLLDRAGVLLGYPFPSGKFLDCIAYESINDDQPLSALLPRVSIDDGYFNLSGAETRVMQYVKENDISNDDIDQIKPLASAMFIYIAGLLTSSSSYLSNKYEIDTVYMAGGVASSKTIRELIDNNGRPDILFGDPVLSGDNAVGIARLSKRIHNK